ncbi:hypothetical protein Mag101_16740 [Microbulbifer agarilyticus]|uniref:Uncharacterized protein n=1 Tax=Microbulbifer agarilyticus TaxID=260552 RepID=A0A1Q2M8V6_9GAMM|nr:hypothetical protein Mag101_16740 [Microbulbifer agarilyticus]
MIRALHVLQLARQPGNFNLQALTQMPGFCFVDVYMGIAEISHGLPCGSTQWMEPATTMSEIKSKTLKTTAVAEIHL